MTALIINIKLKPMAFFSGRLAVDYFCFGYISGSGKLLLPQKLKLYQKVLFKPFNNVSVRVLETVTIRPFWQPDIIILLLFL